MGKKLFLFAAAAVALASCTETDLSGDTSFAKESTSDAIQFSAKAGNSGVTRAGKEGTITTASLKTGAHKDAGFGVMAYQTSADIASPIASLPNFMYNQKIYWDSSNGFWKYEPVKYWPNGTNEADKKIDEANANGPSNTAISTNVDRLSFFAYAPWVEVAETYEEAKIQDAKLPSSASANKKFFYTTGSSSTALVNGIAAIKANTVAEAPEVYYYMPTATTAAAVDLLWGLRGSKQYKETDATDNPETALTNLGSTYNVNLFKQDVPETVDFLFKHALSKIGGNTISTTSTTGSQKCGFKVVVDVDGNGSGINGVDNQKLYLGKDFDNTKTLVTISSVSIQDGKSAWDAKAINGLPADPALTSNLINSGWFDLSTGKWNNVAKITAAGSTTDAPGATYDIKATTAGGTGIYKLNNDIAEPTSLTSVTAADKASWTGDNSAGKPRGVTTAAKEVYSNDAGNDVPALLLIPNGSNEQTLYVTVDYFVRTADPKLSTGYSEVEQIVTNMVSLKGLDVNKYYTLVMHLGLTSVKFSAIVSDWANSDNATYDEDGTHDGDAEAAEEVWLPSNVVAQTTTTTAAPGTASNVNTAASNNTYTITLNNLAEGQQISASESAANITAVKIGATDITTTPYTVVTSETSKEIVVTLNANTNVKAVANLLTITQKDASNNTLTTTTVNIVQSAFDIVLTEGTLGTVVNVKDGDNQDVAAAKYSVVVVDSEGKTVDAGNYTKGDGSVTMNDAGVYTVTVTYSDGVNPAISRSIDIRP